MSEHVCKCRECKPEVFPEVPPRTPEFRSVRHHLSTHPTWIKVNGDRIEYVTGALSGEKGWVIRYAQSPEASKGGHRCTCGHYACTEVMYGRVEFGPEDPTKVDWRRNACD